MTKDSEHEIRVLLVDDEDGFLDLAKKFFEKEVERIKLDVTISPEKALDILEKENYDAIVSDYKMPEMNGIEFLETLRAKGDSTPFIILTARGNEEVAMQALNKGANRYLRKDPYLDFRFHELTRFLVEEVIRRKSEGELETFQKWVTDILKSRKEKE